MSSKRQTKSCTAINASVSTPGGDYSRQSEIESSGSAGGTELIITSIVDCYRAEIESIEIVRVILRTVLPSLSKDDIFSVRQTDPSEMRNRISGVDTDTSKTTPKERMVRPPPFIVRLASEAKTEAVMRAKAHFTRLNTSDIDLTQTSDKVTNNLCHTNIFINEVLNPDVYAQFRSLKSSAKNLGFKFVWHRHGYLLARMKGGLQVHTFKSASELRTVANIYNTHENSNNETNNNNRNAKHSDIPEHTQHMPSSRTQSTKQPPNQCKNDRKQ